MPCDVSVIKLTGDNNDNSVQYESINLKLKIKTKLMKTSALNALTFAISAGIKPTE